MSNPSCFKRRLGVEACTHGCSVSDECYGIGRIKTEATNKMLGKLQGRRTGKWQTIITAARLAGRQHVKNEVLVLTEIGPVLQYVRASA